MNLSDRLTWLAAWTGRLAGVVVNHYDRWNGRGK